MLIALALTKNMPSKRGVMCNKLKSSFLLYQIAFFQIELRDDTSPLPDTCFKTPSLSSTGTLAIPLLLSNNYLLPGCILLLAVRGFASTSKFFDATGDVTHIPFWFIIYLIDDNTKYVNRKVISNIN